MRPSISLLVLLMALAVAAAEPPPDQTQPTNGQPVRQESQTPSTVAQKTTPPAPASTKPKPTQDTTTANASPDVFKPSENVSEDAAVPYPSDI